MSDLYFFKKISMKQWLGLRSPANLTLEVGDDGKIRQPADWRYEDASPLPDWAFPSRRLVLQLDPGGGVIPVLASTVETGWHPFQASLDVLSKPEQQDLVDAMAKAIQNPMLPLRLYQAYRDFPADPGAGEYSNEAFCVALVRALGGSTTNQPVEAYSELLFIVDATGPTEASATVDPGANAIVGLRVTAQQSAAAVTLQLASGATPITNGNVAGTIVGTAASAFTPFYRWRRTLGVAERPSTDSGAILIPTVTGLRGDKTDADAQAARPFRLMDRLGPDQLAGELLNYQVELFNPHGRCTHRGRVLVKRQRLDPPAPPLRGRAQLLAPDAGSAQARCSIWYALAAGQADPGALRPVLYRQDYPVVPTGFYGDDDDGALTVARSLGDPASDGFAGSQLFDQLDSDGESLPNLSSHNLDPFEPANAASAEETVDGQQERRLTFTLALEPGMATRLFLALRRDVEGGLAAPESPVATLQHATGPAAGAVRAVPHFERFWGPLPASAWLGTGDARVMLVEGDKETTVRVVVQHAKPDMPHDADLVGGYRLWMRDVAASGDDTPFNALALVQAVPPLVKAYAPLELGRGWTALPHVAGVPPADSEAQDPLKPPSGFILLSEPTQLEQRKNDKEKKERDAALAAKNVAVLTALSALGTRSNETDPVFSTKDNDAALVLGAMQALLGAGAARELVMTVPTRRALQATLGTLGGNWVVFYDQLGNLLGRAIQFWLPKDNGLAAGETPRALYRLTELPSAQDTVALDDFGRVAWHWRGLRDQWRHELEWLVEAVPRYAPIQGLRAGLGPGESAAAMAIRRGESGNWHRLIVPRRQPFAARFGLTQVLDTDEDAFVIALDAPLEFRQSLFNSLARTRQGVLRMVPAKAVLEFRFPGAYDGKAAAFLPAWLKDEKGSTAARPPGMDFDLPAGAPTYGQLVYDEPPCMKLTTKVAASADDVHGAAMTIGPLQRRRVCARVREARPPLKVTPLGAKKMQIAVVLARLDWFYGGASQPAIGHGLLPGDAFIPHQGMSLLRLPEPEAELLVYFHFRGQALQLAAHFRGQALKGRDWNVPTGWDDVTELDWGDLRTWLGPNRAVTLSADGDLQIVVEPTTTLPDRIVAHWRCEGLAVAPITWSEE